MNLNADITVPVTVSAADSAWLPSPQPGVERRMLHRVGGEVACATSVVRYAPGSRFGFHEHTGGEEFLVLDGVFSDEAGDYGAGAYVRNPPGTRHAPRSAAGCTIFVKLWQFLPGDVQRVVLDTRRGAWRREGAPEQDILPMHEFYGVETVLVRWAAGTRLSLPVGAGGEELFVMEGGFDDGSGWCGAGSWLRTPAGARRSVCVGPAGALCYRKTGHLGLATLWDAVHGRDGQSPG
ncbi:MAG: cupin domain-containing protein [Betaproteobacteria bacterium]